MKQVTAEHLNKLSRIFGGFSGRHECHDNDIFVAMKKHGRREMKRIVVMLAVLLVATAAFAQSNQVLSRNAVGYVKSNVERDGLQLVSLTFEDLDGGDLFVSDVVGDQLPSGSLVYLWDDVNAVYQTELLSSRSGWQPNTNPITVGMGVWLRVPGTATSNEYDVYMMGEVPSDTNYVINIPADLTCIGYAYPVATTWTGTQLAATLPASSLLYLWDGTNYVTHVKSSRSGWNTATSLILEPGEGFWVRNVGSQFDWDISKPYTWP